MRLNALNFDAEKRGKIQKIFGRLRGRERKEREEGDWLPSQLTILDWYFRRQGGKTRDVLPGKQIRKRKEGRGVVAHD